MKVIFKKENDKKHKYKAIFYDDNNNKIKTVKFGGYGYWDFTIHKDDIRKQRYLNRHKKPENWNNYMSAGALSRWLLWNKPTLKESLEDFKNKFNLN